MTRPTPAPRRMATRGQVAIAVTVALLGFLLATQLRAQQGLTQRLAVERESDLGQILTELSARNDRIQEEIVELRVRLAQTTGSQEQQKALVEDARKQVAALQIMLGIVPVKGRGVQMSIADPSGSVGPEVLLDAVQELRDAGAEAIEIDGIRVVVSTAFAGRDGEITIGARIIRKPYVIDAIGAPSTLAEAMRIPGGVVDTVGAREGASVRVDERSSVSILSTSNQPVFKHARPRPRR